MTITARDLRNKQFNSGLRGYDATEVREFLEEVAGELETLKRDKLTLQERLGAANDRLKSIRSRESQVQELLATTERTVQDRIATIQAKGQALLSQAHIEAEEIVMRARRDRSEILDDVSILQAQRERFRAELKAQLRAHADLLVHIGGGASSADSRQDGAPSTGYSEFDGYEFGEVAEILDGPHAVDIDLDAGRGTAGNRRQSRRALLRRAADRSSHAAPAQTNGHGPQDDATDVIADIAN